MLNLQTLTEPMATLGPWVLGGLALWSLGYLGLCATLRRRP
jgi:hypothetical protein